MHQFLLQITHLLFEHTQNRQNFNICQSSRAPFDSTHNQSVAIPASELEPTAEFGLGNAKLLTHLTQPFPEHIEGRLVFGGFSLGHTMEASPHI